MEVKFVLVKLPHLTNQLINSQKITTMAMARQAAMEMNKLSKKQT